MPTHPYITVFCYLTSEFLDALDGHAARALGQSKNRSYKESSNKSVFI